MSTCPCGYGGASPHVPRLHDYFGQQVSLSYLTRDIGYGVEEGEDTFLVGPTDWTGKTAVTPINGGPTLYLFNDEVMDIEGTQMLSNTWNPYEQS